MPKWLRQNSEKSSLRADVTYFLNFGVEQRKQEMSATAGYETGPQGEISDSLRPGK